MTTNKFKKAMAFSIVPAVSLGLLAIPANAQDETDSAKETAENTINLKVTGLDRDREANVQLVNSEDKVVAEKTVKRNGARVSFDYNAEDVQDGVLTVAVDGKVYTTIGAKCTAQNDQAEAPADNATAPSSNTATPAAPAVSAAPAGDAATPAAPAGDAAGPAGDTAAPAGDEEAPADDAAAAAGDTSGEVPDDANSGGEEKSGFLGKLGGIGGLAGTALNMVGGSEGLSNMINDGIKNFTGGGNIDPSKLLDLASKGAGMLPQSADEALNENYVKAIEIASEDKNSEITDKEAKDLNLEGTEKETAEAFAEFSKIYAKGLKEYAGDNPTEDQIKEYNDAFVESFIQELEAEGYALEGLKGLAGKALNSPLADAAIAQGAAAADAQFPGAGMLVTNLGGGLKNAVSKRLNNDGAEGADANAGAGAGANAGAGAGADTGESAGAAGADGADAGSADTGAPADTGSPAAGTNTGTPAIGDPAPVTVSADPVEVKTSGNNVELELEIGDYTVDILNADEAKLINCSIELLADEFDDNDVFDKIPTPAAKPQANANANKGPLQPAPRAVAPASAAGAYGPKVDTGGQVETSFVTTLIDFFTK